ncbi:threonine ammonia-lyase IlvA [Ferviditalea candida]|uniref:L-threonine dehydratase n=1 Tax=Ferviditalea candida TaxID=3108399 RepID=A0ABU5ZHC4_9BACL|nr:threonine ammonia-lyase IlvA [Paenibacillaceae bacterium T2]
MKQIQIADIIHASRMLNQVFDQTPLQKNEILSDKYGCNVFLKREDLQVVRSFKIRGAYNIMRNVSEEEMANGVVCASAGNHAQGVAYSCKLLNVQGKIFMPTTTPRQKISQVKLFGGSFVEVILTGDTFDDSYVKAREYCDRENMVFIHPFDDYRTIVGQGTAGLEIMNQMSDPIDYVFVTIGGGGLVSGVGSYIKNVSPETKIVGVEPSGAPGMKKSIEAGRVITLDEIDKFVDGAAVKQVGEHTFEVSKELLSDIVLVPEGKACTTILELYNNNAIVAEPAGALPIAALDYYREQIQGKNVVCIISGGNNDIDRMQEIKERSLIFEGLKHYFMINFPQRAGALREFMENVLGPTDDITRFEYTKKNNRESGPALVGIELKKKEDYDALIERMKAKEISYIEINKEPQLFNFLV